LKKALKNHGTQNFGKIERVSVLALSSAYCTISISRLPQYPFIVYQKPFFQSSTISCAQ